MSVRAAIESLYVGVCSVSELETERDKKTGRSVQVERAVIENQPCRLSFVSHNTTTKNNDIVYEKPQEVKLFISPDIVIKEGSKIVVTQNGRTKAYKSSGAPCVYVTHQEITLENFERWA